MIVIRDQMFPLGELFITPDAQAALLRTGHCPWEFLARHVRGDFGDVPPDDRQANLDALMEGARLMSSYKLVDGSTLWVITEAENADHQREATTLLLPENY
jgi:hypothetical protein